MSDVVLKADDVAEEYIKIRDAKSKYVKESDEKIARFDAALDKRELWMMTFLNNTGQESAKTAAGTFFKKTSTKVSVADRDVYLPWMIENNLTHFITAHVSKSAVDEYIAEHDQVPPGLNVVRITSISVTRPQHR